MAFSKPGPGRKRFEVQLVEHLGKNYEEKVQDLRRRLISVMIEGDMTYLEAAYKSGTDISTLSNFIGNAHSFYKSDTLQSSSGKRTKPPRDNVSWKTYRLIKKFVDKRYKPTPEKLEAMNKPETSEENNKGQ